MAHLGVDPGGKGAWALLDAQGALVASEHLPLDGEGFVDAASLIATWRALGIERATIERVGNITRVKGRAMGIKGRFNFGFNAGVPRSVLQILGVPFDYVDPSVWNFATGVSADKATSLAAARGLWPDHAGTTFRRKLDVDRAEAALIARYGMRTGTAKKSRPMLRGPCPLPRAHLCARSQHLACARRPDGGPRERLPPRLLPREGR